MSSFFMRFTPRKTSVVLHKEPKFATEIPASSKADEQQMLDSVAISSPEKQRQEQEEAAIASSSSTSTKNKKYYRGMEIISLPSCTIPEPRVSVVGHAFLTILWWGAFAFFGALTIFVFFFLHKNFQSVALPTMQSQNPVIPVQFSISCTETANSWNEGDLISTNRTITSTLTTRYSSASSASPSSCQSLSTQQPMLLSSSSNRDANSNSNGSFTFTSLLQGTLCFEPDQPYSALPARPDIFGMFIELSSPIIPGVTSTPQCYVDFYSTMVPPEQQQDKLTSNSTFSRLRRMNVETLAVRVLTVGHYSQFFTTARRKGESDLIQQYIYPQVYDLEGLRGSAGLENENLGAIVVVKFLNTAIAVTEDDPRTFFNFVGWFGSWWRSTDLFLFWVFPLLSSIFARNFLEDAETGKIDGYTKDILADAWKPLFSLWIAQVLMKTLGQLITGKPI